MEKSPQTDSKWLYVVIQNPGTPSEELMGFETEAIPTPFIPAFNSKEEAQQCFLIMPKDIMHNKYEIQAVIKEDLIEKAKSNHCKLLLMDEKGSIKESLE